MSQNQENTKELLTIEPTEFEPFDPNIATRLRTTFNLAKLLNARLKPIFQDYYGSFIEPTPNGVGLAVSLQFRQIPANKVDENRPIAFTTLQGDNSTLSQRVNNVRNSYSSGKKFFITDDAKNALKILFQNPDKVNWNNVTTEKMENMGTFRESKSVIVGLDFQRVCEYIFGSNSQEAGKLFYNANIVSPVATPNMVRPNNWIVSLQMMTQKSTEEMCSELGLISTGSFNCVTEA